MSAPVTLDTFEDTVLALLESAIEAQGAVVGLHEDRAPADYEAKVITAPLPYLVLVAGDEVSEGPRRITGDASRERVFQLVHVGATRAQARGAGNLAFSCLQLRRLDTATFPGGSVIRRIERSGTRTDDVYTGVGKQPLVYGTDTYQYVP